MEFGIATVAAIVALAYLVGMFVKAIGLQGKWVPVICGCVGVVLGVIGMGVMPDFPATDWLTAAAVGGVSGLAATGVHQIGKLHSEVE